MKVRHPEFVLAAATAVCLPMVPGLLSGEITAIAAAERFLLALIGCWFLGSVVSWVINTYAEQSRRSDLLQMVQNSLEEPRTPPAAEQKTTES